MENRFENSPEEQGWKAPLPPRIDSTLRQTNAPDQDLLRDNLCAWVREKLSDLLDNDGSIRPEQAAGIYAHLAICRPCAQEFDELKHIVALVEDLPPAELPCDFSGLIMFRIENPHAPLQKHAVSPLAAAEMTSAVVAATPALQNMAAKHNVTSVQTIEQQVTALHQQNQHTQQAQTRLTQSETLRRMTVGGILSAVLAYFLSNPWGRQMLGNNLLAANTWLSQIADVLGRVPVLTWMVGLIFSALAQLNVMLSQTYHVMGPAAAVGVALDVAVCAVAYGFLTVRRREAQTRF